MSIRDKIAATFGSTPIEEPDETAFTTARDALEHTARTLTELRDRHRHVLADLEKQEARLQQVALDAEASGTSEHYDQLTASVAKQDRDLKRIQHALEGAAAAHQQAQAALDKLGKSGQVKSVKRLTSAIVAKGDRVTAAFNEVGEALTAYAAATDKLKFSWPLPGTTPGGHLLGIAETERALAQEAYRVVGQHIASPKRKLSIPAAAPGIGLGDPKQMKSFADHVRDAAASLVAIVERGIDTVKPAPQPVDELDEMVAQAAQPEMHIKSTREIIDLRKTKQE